MESLAEIIGPWKVVSREAARDKLREDFHADNLTQ